MYIYFDKNGTIKEVINDESIRKGSNDYNKIYCYLEGNPVIDDIWYLQKNPDGTLTNEVSFVDNIVTKSIPYDRKRDMKHFQDFEEYKFYVFTLSSSYLSQNGLVVATIRVAENNTLWALGELTFNVQANIVNSDNDITQSQYDYLLLTISSYYSKTEIDNKLNSKADKSDTYTKQEVNELTDGLSGEIDTVRKSVNSLNTRTSILENTVDDLRNAQQLADVVPTYADLQEYYVIPLDPEDKVQVLSDDTHDGDSTVYKWDGSNWIYIGSYSSNTYNKTEVDGKFDVVGEEFGTLSNSILDLQTSVSDLKSVQNVVDVVPTYAALQKYDASKVETYDKIQVIADETHDGASTIYNRLGNAWYYVGAFGTNSYTKTEVDTKLSTKADKDDTYTKQEVNDKLNGYIKDNDTTYSATVRGKEVIVSGGAGYGSTTYKNNSIQTSNPRKPTCDYSFPDGKSGTLALTSDIPTVNNPTITFTQGGVTKGSITLNQSSDQTIDLDGILIGTYLEDIYDSHENNRFTFGYGIWAAVPGMQGESARWSLNGYNLMFEAMGLFQTNVAPDTPIVSFKLPIWILNKIPTPTQMEGIIDMFNFTIASKTTGISSADLLIYKTTDEKVIFNAIGGVAFTEPKLFRIRYNLIIDD